MTSTLKINRILFKASSTPASSPLDVEVPNVTVLVGPNNSGKSQALREIEEWCHGKKTDSLVIAHIDLDFPNSFDQLLSALSTFETSPPEDRPTSANTFWVARPAIRADEESIYEEIDRERFRREYGKGDSPYLRRVFVRNFTLRLDGRTRFDLVDPKDTGPLEKHPENHLWALFVNDDAREKVRQFTSDAFEKYYVIDPTGMQKFRVRLSDRKPRSKTEEQSLDKRARKFHENAPLVSRLGDGLRTSIGLVSAVMSLPQQILLIDEPEAFLHPTLARRVGSFLSQTARERNASLITATHSADFLYGCIQSAPDLRIVRLTYQNGKATARSIAPGKIVNLMHDPLLRSANTLRSLFYRAVIVTEADADRALYDEVNFRLLQVNSGIEDALFLNGQNWQTIPRIVAPLREIGIPAAAIFDLDVIMADQFKCLWGLFAGHADIHALQRQRKVVQENMKLLGKDKIKKQGINSFDKDERRVVEDFIGAAKEFGVFFVSVGELESWFSHLGVRRRREKPAWLTDVFSRLGSDPDSASYTMPSGDDVWEFVKSIGEWAVDSNAKGMAS